jgi:hypothetical protein
MGPSININQRKNHRKPLFFFLKKKRQRLCAAGPSKSAKPPSLFFQGPRDWTFNFFYMQSFASIFFLKKLVMRRLICPEFGHCGG